ncbi:MAG TPA: 3-isopropylmalate dehydratase large subunit [Thermomicrobiales bacterium]|nr:3-isopropylmalate dehydratase large subunit [Thermomicrobiales bacterium]
MTMTEKIMARHAGLDRVEPGQLIEADVDLMMGNDITAPIAIKRLKDLGMTRLPFPDKLFLVMSHYAPSKDIASAAQIMISRQFAKEQQLPHYYAEGAGIEHVILPEEGWVLPGDLVIGADSHSCTYGATGCFATGVGSTDLAAAMATGRLWFKVPESLRFELQGSRPQYIMGKDIILHIIGLIGADGALYQAMEYAGDALRTLPMEERLTMANMAIEAGAKAGIFPCDDVTEAYLSGRAKRAYTPEHSDPDAGYARTYQIDVAALEPMVALPWSPDNVRTVGDMEGEVVDRVFIGSCTNARLSDLRIVAGILKGNKVACDTLIVPGSKQVYRDAMHEGLFDIFLDAGATVSAPTCGACFGGFMGVLGPNERCLSTSNRNFVGRMGHPSSKSYLANPAVAAATALTGAITHPKDVLAREAALA